MNADRTVALYRQLRHVFPAGWRRHHEAEFVETLHDDARSGSTPFPVRLADLLGLALVLHWHALSERYRSHCAREVGALMCVFALAVLLLVPTLYWSADAPLEFVMTSMLVVLVPGIGVIYTVSIAVAGGQAAGLCAALGCTLGIVPHLLVAFLGLSGMMQFGATVFELVRWAGVAYLMWMGVGLLRDRGGIAFDAAASGETEGQVRAGASRVVMRGVLVNLLNPKLTAFFFAFLPQFVGITSHDAKASGLAQAIDPRLFGLASLFMLLTLIGFVFYALIGALVSRWAAAAPGVTTWTQRAFGALLLGFAARLAVAER